MTHWTFENAKLWLEQRNYITSLYQETENYHWFGQTELTQLTNFKNESKPHDIDFLWARTKTTNKLILARIRFKKSRG